MPEVINVGCPLFIPLLKNWSCANDFYSLQCTEVWFSSCCFLSLNKSTTCIKVTPATAESSYECWYAQWRLHQCPWIQKRYIICCRQRERVPCQNSVHPIFAVFFSLQCTRPIWSAVLSVGFYLSQLRLRLWCGSYCWKWLSSYITIKQKKQHLRIQVDIALYQTPHWPAA